LPQARYLRRPPPPPPPCPPPPNLAPELPPDDLPLEPEDEREELDREVLERTVPEPARVLAAPDVGRMARARREG
jgi:hypothetical protein